MASLPVVDAAPVDGSDDETATNQETSLQKKTDVKLQPAAKKTKKKRKPKSAATKGRGTGFEGEIGCSIFMSTPSNLPQSSSAMVP
jgi:hypothetical protein